MMSNKLGLIAQILFDCEMETIYHTEMYGAPGYLARLEMISQYTDKLTNSKGNLEIYEMLLNDCKEIVKNGCNEENLSTALQALIDFIDNTLLKEKKTLV